MSSTTTRSQIGSDDIKWWDGVSNTFTRLTSTGGSLTLNAIGNAVDVLEAYGAGVNFTGAALSSAVSAIGSTSKRSLVLRPGTWTIDDDLTVSSNLTLVAPHGCTFSIATGKTLTLNGPVEAGPHRIFTCVGTGNVNFGSNDAVQTVWANWWGVDSSSADNSTALTKAIDACSKGAKILFPQGVYTFTSGLTYDGPAGDVCPDNISFIGAGWREEDDTSGTVLKFTAASGYLFNIINADGTDKRGNWHWKDLKIYMTNSAADGAIAINDITDSNPDSVATGCYAIHCSWENVCIKGTITAATSAPDGITAFGLYSSLIDEDCYFEYLRRAVWLRDSDGNKINPRVSYCNASIRIVGSSTTYSNNNEITGMYHNCLDYGDDQYVFYDSGNKTIIRDTQVEADTGDVPFYLDGVNTTLINLRCARYGTNPTYAGTIGPNAKNIRFVNCSGMFGSFSEAAWPRFNVDDTGMTYPFNKYLDNYVTFIDCDVPFCAMIPAHPRLRIEGLKNSNYPEPAGNAGEHRFIMGGRDSVRDEIRSLGLGSRGMGELDRVDYYGHAFSKNLVAGHYSTNCTAIYAADANARHGYAIQLTSVLADENQIVAFPMVVGRDVGINDVIYWEISSLIDGVPTAGEMVCQIWNVTTDIALDAVNLGTHTAYDVVHGYKRLGSGIVTAGDVLLVEFYNNTAIVDDINMFINYCYGGVVPRISQALRQVNPLQIIAYGAAVTPDITKGNYIYIDIAANVAITINAPAAADRVFGERLTFELRNAAGACAITWNAVYQAGTTTITAAKSVVVEFVYNGTTYIQVNTPIEVTSTP